MNSSLSSSQRLGRQTEASSPQYEEMCSVALLTIRCTCGGMMTSFPLMVRFWYDSAVSRGKKKTGPYRRNVSN